jgi:hypothetical protein
MIEITWATLPYIFIHVAVAALGVGRFTRAVVYDDFPPSVWWRDRWELWTDGTGWQNLFTCWWCFSFWVALACIGWWIAGLYFLWVAWAWWIFWGAFALGYLAPMIIVRDQPKD